MMVKRKNFSFLLAIIAGILWGTYGTFATFMMDLGLREETISLIAPLFLAVVFLLLVLMKNYRKLKVAKRNLPILLLYGFFCAGFNWSIVQAYAYFPIGVVSTLVFCNLFLIMILSYFLFKDPFTWQKGVASALAVLGIAMVLNVFSLEWHWSWQGLFWTMSTLVCWAFMVVVEKLLLVREMDGDAIIFFQGFFAVLFISFLFPPWQAVDNLTATVMASGGKVLWPLFGIGLITQVGCYFFYIRALQRIEPAYAQLGFVMDPCTASILGFLIFGQALLPIQIGGVVLILLVVAFVQYQEIHVKPTEKVGGEQGE